MKTKTIGFLSVFFTTVFISGCYYTSDTPDVKGKDIRVTLLHTSDIHSRIRPFTHTPMFTEKKLGLRDGYGPYGGIARIAHVVKRERAKAGRSLWVDSGDSFQGAPIFNLFEGEPEIKSLSKAGLDVFALGNHEFDVGAANVVDKFSAFASYPILAANYDFREGTKTFTDDFASLVDPVAIYNLDGIKIGIIGMGNTSSMTSIHESGNSMGIRPYNEIQTIQDWVHILRSSVDVVMVLSHLGLSTDEYISQNICGLDLVMGGHHHVALDPPKIIPYDPDPEIIFGEHADGEYEPDETGIDGSVEIGSCPEEYQRDVILAHPNAFAKFVTRLDIIVKDGRIRSHSFEMFPIDVTVPEDPEVAELMYDYEVELEREYDLDLIIAKATENLTRFGQHGGDSMLGNLMCEAMQKRKYVETDFCVTNSLGIRTDILEGDITMDMMYNVMPFENTITTMILSGIEVRKMLDYAVERGAGRGCSTQIQVSGVTFTMNCRTGKAEDITIGGVLIKDEMSYKLATNNYMAWGGSGFDMLKINTSKVDTGIALRQAVIDYMGDHPILPQCDLYDEFDKCQKGIAVEDGRIKPEH